MKVTMIGTLPPIKGISAYCLELLNFLSKKVNIEFISFKKLYPEFLYPGGKVEDKTCKVKLKINRNIKIRRTLTYYNPFTWLWVGFTVQGHIIHAHWWTTFFTPIYLVIFLIAKLRKRKVVITAHNILPHEIHGMDIFFTRIIFSFANKIIVHSDVGITQCEDQLGIPSRKLKKIPHGILGLVSNRGITKEKARKKLNIPLDKKVILYFGNIRKYKGLDTLIKSFSLIAKQHDDAILVVAGKPWENWKKYEVLIQKHNLINEIKLFLDYIPQSEIGYFFSAADLVVLPYKKFTSQSGVGMLALPFHKPLIVTDVGGLPMLVLDKNLVVPPDNPQLLAERIGRVIKNDDLLKKLSKDSKVIAEQFSWHDISKKTIKVYKELLRRE